jgi:hypothetical protein
MKNPYFETFFKLFDKSQWSSLFDSPKIDMMDHLVIMCRFLGTNELISKIEEMINAGVANGNLEIIALIGLNSEKLFPLLQHFVDKTSDLQTAAYISAYAINV